MISKITYANSIYPTTQEELDTRRRYQQEAIGHNENLLQLMRLTLNEIPSIDANKLNRAVELIIQESKLLRAWKKASKILQHVNRAPTGV